MATKNHNLHGSAPDKSETALLNIDVINDLYFPEGGQLLRHALPMAHQIAALKKSLQLVNVPVIYANEILRKTGHLICILPADYVFG